MSKIIFAGMAALGILVTQTGFANEPSYEPSKEHKFCTDTLESADPSTWAQFLSAINLPKQTEADIFEIRGQLSAVLSQWLGADEQSVRKGGTMRGLPTALINAEGVVWSNCARAVYMTYHGAIVDMPHAHESEAAMSEFLSDMDKAGKLEKQAYRLAIKFSPIARQSGD